MTSAKTAYHMAYSLLRSIEALEQDVDHMKYAGYTMHDAAYRAALRVLAWQKLELDVLERWNGPDVIAAARAARAAAKQFAPLPPWDMMDIPF